MLIGDVLIELDARKAVAIAQRTLVALRHIGLVIGFATEVELVLGARIVHLQGMEVLVIWRGGPNRQLARVIAVATELIVDAQPACVAASNKGSCLAIAAHIAKVTFRWNGRSHRNGS